MSHLPKLYRSGIAALAAVIFLAACAGLGNAPQQPVVTTDAGQLRGVQIDGMFAFKGIPFAAPPVGEWRWRPPQPVEAWQGVRNADTYAPFCPQYAAPMLWFELTEMSEDCLALNVWTPQVEPDARLPVMVWIHGGGYVNGSGNIARLNSTALAKKGVVLVTINYRLSLWGFMTHPDLMAQHPEDPAGNYGLLDVVASLEWVQKNIRAFGGDPDNVTIFGESAGASLVNYLMVTPASEGLFHRAISQSASVGMAPEAYVDRRAGFQPPAEKLALAYVKKLGVAPGPDAAAKLRAMTTEQLLAVFGERDRFIPVVDGVVVPGQPGTLFAEGRQHKVPYMTGSVSWEAALGRAIGGAFSPEFMARLVPATDKEKLYGDYSGAAQEDAIFGDVIIHSHSRYLANQMVAAGQPVHVFYMSYVASDRRGRQPGVAHADDIAFVMGTLDAERDLETISARDREISELMSDYWVQFAKTGNPNAAGLPAWPAYQPDTARVMEFGDTVKARDAYLAERMKFHMERGEALLQRSQ